MYFLDNENFSSPWKDGLILEVTSQGVMEYKLSVRYCMIRVLCSTLWSQSFKKTPFHTPIVSSQREVSQVVVRNYMKFSRPLYMKSDKELENGRVCTIDQEGARDTSDRRPTFTIRHGFLDIPWSTNKITSWLDCRINKEAIFLVPTPKCTDPREVIFWLSISKTH